jgi:hypothetical protein
MIHPIPLDPRLPPSNEGCLLRRLELRFEGLIQTLNWKFQNQNILPGRARRMETPPAADRHAQQQPIGGRMVSRSMAVREPSPPIDNHDEATICDECQGASVVGRS